MKRLFHSAIVWRLAIVALIFVIADLASAPPVLGSGPTLAVTAFKNVAGAPEGTVGALSSALYQAVDQSGKFSAVGGGPLEVQPALDGSMMGPAIAAAERAGANEVVLGELLSASGGDVVYRLTAYRVAPLMFIRSQIFSQSSLANASLAAGFVTNLNTLHAPRAAIGTIYSLTNGIHADLGSVYGFQMGEQFNVMRNGQKMAQATISGLDEDSATVDITNASSGYKPEVGDQLVGLQPLPAINPPPSHSNAAGLAFLGLIVTTGVALLAIGHHGQPAASGQGPAPSPSPGGMFSVACGTQVGQGSADQSFSFTFSQQVNTASINLSSPAQIYFTTSVSASQEPLTALGGTQTFTSSNTILTVTGTNLVPGQQITFFFTTGVFDTGGAPLTPSSCLYTLGAYHHKAPTMHPPAGHHPGKP